MSDTAMFDLEFGASRDQLENNSLLSRVPHVRQVLEVYPFSQSAKALNCLPLIVHNELGGTFGGANLLGASFMLLNLASEVLDDLQDRDCEYPWVHWAPAVAVNVALAMTFQAFELLGSLQNSVAVRAIEALAGAGVSASIGQARQAEPEMSMTIWLRQAREKSGVVMASGALVGAIAATDDKRIHKQAKAFGMSLGVLSQAVDDVIDLVTADPHQCLPSDNLCVVTAQLQRGVAESVTKSDIASRTVLAAVTKIVHKLETDAIEACADMPLMSERLRAHVVGQRASLEQLALSARAGVSTNSRSGS